MIKNVVFDIGNVLLDWAWDKYFASFGFPLEHQERIAKATVLAPTWDDFDRGAHTDEELIDMFVANDPGMEKEIRMLCGDIHDMLIRHEGAIPWIEELKAAGYKTYYLSNFSLKAKIQCAHTLDFMPHMDGGIMSYEIKKVKPEPEIYLALLEKYDLKPEECVFLDDRKSNLDAAEKLGFHTILVESEAKGKAALKELLGY